MGSVLTPVIDGLPKAKDLPSACTLNGHCQEVCPVAIPLPTLIRGWRAIIWRNGLESAVFRRGIGLWLFLAQRPVVYRWTSEVAIHVMACFARAGWIVRMPLAYGWTRYRDLPKPAPATFMTQYRRRASAATRLP
jgi:L-lactate dehydrogenase complex protein LldF